MGGPKLLASMAVAIAGAAVALACLVPASAFVGTHVFSGVSIQVRLSRVCGRCLHLIMKSC